MTMGQKCSGCCSAGLANGNLRLEVHADPDSVRPEGSQEARRVLTDGVFSSGADSETEDEEVEVIRGTGDAERPGNKTAVHTDEARHQRAYGYPRSLLGIVPTVCGW